MCRYYLNLLNNIFVDNHKLFAIIADNDEYFLYNRSYTKCNKCEDTTRES